MKNEKYHTQRLYFVPRNFNASLYRITLCRSRIYTKHGLTLIPAQISNYLHYKVWDEITYPFPNFNGATVEVMGMDRWFHLTCFWSYDYLFMLEFHAGSSTMFVKGATGICSSLCSQSNSYLNTVIFMPISYLRQTNLQMSWSKLLRRMNISSRFMVFCYGPIQISFTHILQGCFSGRVAIIRLPLCHWSNPDEYGWLTVY